ncbi:aminotransferase, classes I and II family [Aspergillus fumigatus Af293]|uniref:Aminotransferase, classes I and II family n=1 Tax=Aspergillus fumigatus (strain ATCC MYA-4609 / CBS 101355 / FGSC A1100 / Af293) TaxID=330879 RepID=Q4WBA2_ASPFU|nr:aminotransferase, classes I and II family [Aspergillus fumigatus Af293]EAL85010.1 aminotransferase, classes I and II family [Aspergillus fumigatus Af293]KEY82170.1 aminotransferase classes I and II [Aspergillus fumigatus]
MLSARGETYAKAGLANSYLEALKTPYNKDNKQGVVSFRNAENVLSHILLLVASRLDHSDLTYHEGPFGSRRLRAAMANHITTYFHPATPISPDHIIFANGVTSLNALCALSLTDPGDGILLGQPIYGSFNGDLRVPSGCQLIYTSFHGDDQFSPDAVTRYEEAFLQARETGVTARALLICNPHNPLGRCYPRETLEALLQFCQKYQLHLISDEVYALSVYDDADSTDGFVSVLSIDPVPLGVDPALIHVLYGMSKDFAASGLRLGCLISRNKRFLQAVLSMSIAAAVLEDQGFVESFLQKSRRLLRSQRDLAARALDEAGIPYAQGAIVTSQDGWAAELALSRQLQQIGVEMSTGYAYHNEVPGWFRVIFSLDEESLKEGLSR